MNTYNQFDRTKLLIGDLAVEKLFNKKVIVFGLGGVGGAVCESLSRVGIGSIDIVDNDIVDITNMNRQIIATYDTIGKNKVDVMRDRMLSINKDLNICSYKCFFSSENSDSIDFRKYDYIIDAIDTIKSKIELVKKATENNIKIISAMGAGNRINAMSFKVCDIYETRVCPLAKIMRKELKKIGVERLKVVYSDELPKKSNGIATVSYMPLICGFIISYEVIKDLLNVF